MQGRNLNRRGAAVGKLLKRLVMTVCLVLLSESCFASCDAMGRSEPEQIYLVSAIGIDADGRNFCLSLEILSGQGEAERNRVCKAKGTTLSQAFEALTSTLSKEVSFSHCALMVLGETLDREQMKEAFAFAGMGEKLPLAAQVAVAPSAEELLNSESLSFPRSAGYSIPELFQLAKRQYGWDIGCEIYRLRSDNIQKQTAILPYFRVLKSEKSDDRASFEGFFLLKEETPPLRLNREEGIGYAVLTGQFRGTRRKNALFSDVPFRVEQSSLRTEVRDNKLYFTIECAVAVPNSRYEYEWKQTGERLKELALQSFTALQKSAPQDLYFFYHALWTGEQSAEPEPSMLADAGLELVFRIRRSPEGI